MTHTSEGLFLFREVPRCNACQSGSQRQLGFRGGTAHRSGEGIRARIVACEECGLIFSNPMPIPKVTSLLYDTAAEEYFKHHDLQNKRNNVTFELTKLEKRTTGRRLLDVGCGQGVLLDVARSRGWEVTGLDVSEQFAKYAHDKLNVQVRVGDITTTKLEPESFDVVILTAILEHLLDPRQILLKIQKALRPSGLVSIDVPNERGLYYRIGNFWQRMRGRDWVVNLSPTFSPGHLHGFSPHSLTTMLHQTGFANVHTELYQGVNCLPPARNVVEQLERVCTSAVMLSATVLKLGDGMKAIAVKPENTRSTSA